LANFPKAFRRNIDGSWTCVASTSFDGSPLGRIEVAAGTSFCRGKILMNVDVAEWLDRYYGWAPAAES
jgi:hypothetical protein